MKLRLLSEYHPDSHEVRKMPGRLPVKMAPAIAAKYDAYLKQHGQYPRWGIGDIPKSIKVENDDDINRLIKTVTIMVGTRLPEIEFAVGIPEEVCTEITAVDWSSDKQRCWSKVGRSLNNRIRELKKYIDGADNYRWELEVTTNGGSGKRFSGKWYDFILTKDKDSKRKLAGFEELP